MAGRFGVSGLEIRVMCERCLSDTPESMEYLVLYHMIRLAGGKKDAWQSYKL